MGDEEAETAPVYPVTDITQTAVDTPHVTRHCIELQGEGRICGGREGSEKSSDSGLLPSSPSSSPSSTPSRRASSLLLLLLRGRGARLGQLLHLAKEGEAGNLDKL